MDDHAYRSITRKDALLRLVPDIPRWVETRGMLVMGRGHAVVDPSGPDSFVAVSDVAPMISMVGRPAAEIVRGVVGARVKPPEVLADLDTLGHTLDILAGWHGATFLVHEWRDRVTVPRADVRFLDRDQLPVALPPVLFDELSRAAGWSPIAATFVDGMPVSFCYSTSETETLWDVSIDTLVAYRGRGLAAPCVDAMIERMLRSGKRPVWGALDENASSLALARKLGFLPVDRKVLVTLEPFEFENGTVA
jgi:hypothetical protein